MFVYISFIFIVYVRKNNIERKKQKYSFDGTFLMDGRAGFSRLKEGEWDFVEMLGLSFSLAAEIPFIRNATIFFFT